MKNNLLLSKVKLLAITAIVSVLFLLTGCNNFIEKSYESEKTGIKIEIKMPSRQIMPTYFLETVFADTSFKITGNYKDNDDIKYDETIENYSTLLSKQFYFDNGDWDFTLEMIKDSATIATSTLSATITTDTSVISFEFNSYNTSGLDYSTGSGALCVTLKFPKSESVTKVTAGIYDDLSDSDISFGTIQEVSTFNADGDYQSVTYSAESVPSGAYYVIFKIYQNDTVIAFCPEFVYVANGAMSAGEFTFDKLNEIYTINYVLNELSFKEGFTGPASYTKKQNITLPVAAFFTIDDYFKGWYETEDFSDTAITGWNHDEKTGNITLYARNTVTVKFEMNGYGTAISDAEILYNTTLKKTTPVDSDGAKLFDDWYTDSEFTTTWDFSSKVTDNMTLYAKWLNLSDIEWSYPESEPTLTWTGNGTEEDPYMITTPQQLADLSYMVNNGTIYEGKYFALGNDIELNHGIEVSATTKSAKQWTPIGNSDSNCFKGTFDGRNHTINGLYINSDAYYYAGLFGHIINGTVRNVVLGKGYISNTKSSSYAGGIAGYTYNNTTITNCGNAGTNISSSSYAGGIVGYVSYSSNNCTTNISSCYNTGSISSSSSSVGGIVGYVSHNSDSYCTTNISNSYNTGSIYSSSSYVGGIVGYVSYTSLNRSCTTNISNSYNRGELSGEKIGGIYGYCVSNYDIYNCYSKINYCYYYTATASDYGGDGTVANTGIGTFPSPTEPVTKMGSGYSGTLIECLNAWVCDQTEDYYIWHEDENGWPTLATPSEYSVTYELNGGTNASSNPATAWENHTLTLAEPTKLGYTFDGWYSESEFTNMTKQIRHPTSDVKLYAKWKPYDYSITYNLNGGKNSANNPEKYNIESEKIVLENPTREGYTFLYWYKDIDLSKKISEIPTGSSGNLTLYATWKKDD